MTRFHLWSPEASTALVDLDDRHAPMARDARRGWWFVDVAGAGPGTDYRFGIDGRPVRPDPRSRWQPAGVHGPSRLVDGARAGGGAEVPSRSHVLDLSTSVLYEIHIGTFTSEGTFDAAVERLDHLVDLGVDAVEIMPVVQFAGDRGWGYDGVDLYAPHASYGGPAGLERFVAACHGRGLGVVLDVVYNHFGPEGAYLSEFGPYINPAYQTTWGGAVNYDGPHSDGVRQFVIDNALMWLRDFDIDGLRIDAVHAMVDHSALHVLEELAGRVVELSQQTGRPRRLIAESELNDPRLVRAPEAGGFGLDAAWADELHHTIHTVLTGERAGYYAEFGSMAQLDKALRQAWVYDGVYSPYRQRIHGRSPHGLRGDQFVVALQNHDQVGNRALGERITRLTTPARVRIGAALVLLSPFVPMLFQGEEWGASSPFQYFTSHGDPELARAVREGRRAEFAGFGWRPEDVPDPQDEATFLRSKLDWSELDRPPHAEMLAWYRSLLALRRRLPDLRTGGLDEVVTRYGESPPWFVFERGAVTVLVNLAPEPVSLEVDRSRPSDVLLSSPAGIAPPGPGGRTELPPDSVAILGWR